MTRRAWTPAATFLVGLVTCATPALSSAQDWYVSGSLGASFREPDNALTTSTRNPFGNSATLNGQAVTFDYASHATYDTGFDADLAVGRILAKAPYGRVRSEIDFEYRRFQQSTLTTQRLPNAVESFPYVVSASTQSGLNSSRYAGTVNLFYDLTMLAWVQPYVGGGIGYQRGTTSSGVRTRLVYTTNGDVPVSQSGTVNVASDDESSGTYLLEGGLTFPLTSRLSIAPAYRYTNTVEGGRATHVAKVGLRYCF